MANGHSEEFKRDAVCIALTSGLTRRQVSVDLGIGLSTLNKWIKLFDEEAVVCVPDQELARENGFCRKLFIFHLLEINHRLRAGPLQRIFG